MMNSLRKAAFAMIAAASLTLSTIAKADDSVVSFTIKGGEMNYDSGKIGWWFSTSNGSEFFDLSANAWLTRASTPEIKGLVEVGLVFPGGHPVFYRPDGSGRVETVNREAKKHAPGTRASGIFANLSEKLVAFKTYEPTKVVRFDLTTSELGSFTFWQNLNGLDVLTVKSPQKAKRWSPSYEIRAGVLAPVEKQGKQGYVFRWEGGEEWYVARREGAFRDEAGRMSPPSLRWIGLKLEGGVRYIVDSADEERSESAAVKAVGLEHPDRKIVARLFEGEAGALVEIAMAEVTPVFRADVKVGSGKSILWSNRDISLPGE